MLGWACSLKGGGIMSAKVVANQLEYDEEKMFTRLVAQFEVLNMGQSVKAAYFARNKHANAVRKTTGQPYIVHPLLMASIAMAMGMREDSLIAVILLHDVIEDTDTELSDLPVGDIVKHGVSRMTFTMRPGEDKDTAKARYFYELSDSKEAVICKALDRFVNLYTMAGQFPVDKIRKNVVETDQLLMPILRDAKSKWPEISTNLWLLRVMIRSVNETLAGAYDIPLMGERLYGGASHYANVSKSESVNPDIVLQ